MALVVVGLTWFILAYGVQGIQEAFNIQLASDNWASPENWESFNLANNFVNNLWIYFLVFLVLGLSYYGYVEAQRVR